MDRASVKRWAAGHAAAAPQAPALAVADALELIDLATDVEVVFASRESHRLGLQGRSSGHGRLLALHGERIDLERVRRHVRELEEDRLGGLNALVSRILKR